MEYKEDMTKRICLSCGSEMIKVLKLLEERWVCPVCNPPLSQGIEVNGL